jgi:hypothetical protein
MPEVHRAEVRRTARGEPAHVEPQTPRSTVHRDLEQRAGQRVQALARRRKDEPAAALQAQVSFERPELAEGVDLALAVGADAERGSRGGEPVGREDAVAEIPLGEGTGADARRCEERDLVRREVHRVHGGEACVEEAEVIEELDRAAAVLGEAGLDLARLLGDVHVHRRRTGAVHGLDPGARERAHAVRGGTNGEQGGGARAVLERGHGGEEAVGVGVVERRCRGSGRALKPGRA